MQVATLHVRGSLLGITEIQEPPGPPNCVAAERERLVASLEREREPLSAVLARAPSFFAVLRGPDHVFERVN